MTRSIDGVVTRPTPVDRSEAPTVPASRAFTRRGPTFEPVVSKDRAVGLHFRETLSAGTSAHPKVQHTKPLPQQPIRRQFAKPAAPTTSRKSIPQWIQMPLIIGGAMLAGLAMQNVLFGQLGIIAYGAAALMLGIPSRTSFILALLSMLATTGLLVFKGDVALSQNFAVYTFLLLVVGVITLNRELKKEGGRIYSRRIRN